MNDRAGRATATPEPTASGAGAARSLPSSSEDRIGLPRELGYVPALDGVRAIAVIAVIGVHTRPRLAPGGSVGVDVFFVLSGFLITTLLLQEHDRTGRIAVGRFYGRRALRLLPALALVLAAVVAWAVLVASPSTRTAALREALAAGTYTRNWTGPWAHTPGPLLGHTWSLALEEQFYLLWPWMLLAGLAIRNRAAAAERHLMIGRRQSAAGAHRVAAGAAAALAACTVAAVLARGAGVQGWSALLLQRPEALLLGAAVALVRRRASAITPDPAVLSRCRGAMRWTVVAAVSTVALAVLIVAPWSLSLRNPAVSAASVAAAALVSALVAAPDNPVARVFAARPARAIGRVSYGVYLWQQPVLRWVDDRLPGRSALVRIPAAAVLIAIAATASYLVVERRALRWKSRLGRTAPTAPVAAPAVVG